VISPIDVGDVAGIDDVSGPVTTAQKPDQDVENHRRAGVADVGKVIDRRSADIEGHALRITGLEDPFGAGQGVVEHERHGGGRSGLLAGKGDHPI
jgi:hypothetical protein